jgi:porphobilinogen synthase
VSPTTLVRGRLADHPLWSRALAAPALASHVVKPVIVSARVEDRERVPDAPWLERLSITELVRDARAAASAGLAGLLLFGVSDRKDERAMIASERDHIVTRAIHAVKDAAPDLAVAADVCVCAYTPHGQCVLFSEGNADVEGTLARLSEIALVYADAGADLLMPSGMLDGAVRALRAALAGVDHGSVPVASVIKLESQLYASHRRAVEAIPLSERAVQLIAAEDRDAPRARALRDIAAGADAIVMKPGLVALDHVTRIATAADRPVLSFFTADEHSLFFENESLTDASAAEREGLIAARRAGADLVVTYADLDAVES